MRNLIAFLVLGATLAGCSGDPVDRELVGTWQTAITSEVGAWQLRFTTLSNGQYRTEFLGPFPVPPETGYFAAEDGEWRIEKIAGSIEEGTYEFLSEDSMLFRTPAGAIVWNRVAGNPAAATSFSAPGDLSLPAATGFSPPAVSADAAGSAVRPDLFATGPFGVALPGTSSGEATAFARSDPPSGDAGTAPFGATVSPPASASAAPFGSAFSPPPSGAPFGAGAPSAFGAPAPFGVPNMPQGSQFGEIRPSASTSAGFGASGNAGAAFGGPRTVDGALNNVERQLESDVRQLGNLPQQTIDTLERDMQRTAAQAVNEAAAPVTEAADEVTRKAGQRVQRFTSNAASKVRNFFTRGNRSDDEGNESEQEDR